MSGVAVGAELGSEILCDAATSSKLAPSSTAPRTSRWSQSLAWARATPLLHPPPLRCRTKTAALVQQERCCSRIPAHSSLGEPSSTVGGGVGAGGGAFLSTFPAMSPSRPPKTSIVPLQGGGSRGHTDGVKLDDRGTCDDNTSRIGPLLREGLI